MKNILAIFTVLTSSIVGCNSETEEQRIRREESEVIFEKVAAIVAKQFNIDVTSISRKTTFKELGSSPEDFATIIQAVQREFDVVIPNMAQDGIDTVEKDYQSGTVQSVANLVTIGDVFGDDFRERLGRPAKQDQEQLP